MDRGSHHHKSQSSHKRFSDSDYSTPPSKKHRADLDSSTTSSSPHKPHFNGHHNRPSHLQQWDSPTAPPRTSLTPSNLPPLPPIAPEYEIPVFTHPALGSAEASASTMLCYDKLEFLGDAYLELIASRLIYNLSTQKLSSARMSQLRESMIKNETLSEYAVAYGFDKKLRIPDASRPVGRTSTLKVNGDVFEAYVAAVALSPFPSPPPSSNPTARNAETDSGNIMGGPAPGFQTLTRWLTSLWSRSNLLSTLTTLDDESSKPTLQKKLGGKGVLINYVEERPRIIHKGKGIEQYFIGVYLTGWGWDNQLLGQGEGTSIKKAGMAAALDALTRNEALVREIERVKEQAKKRETVEAEKAKVGTTEEQ